MRGKHNLLKAFGTAVCGAFFLMVMGALFFGSDFVKTTNTIISILIVIMIVCLLAMAALSIILYFNKEAREEFRQWMQKKEKKDGFIYDGNMDQQNTDKRNNRSILSPNESKFKKYLEEHIPDHIEINCKIHMISALPFPENKRYNPYTNQSEMMMHIDFVLITKETHEVVLAIELQDKSHDTDDAKRRDEKKSNAMKSAKLNFAQIKLEEAYEPKYLKRILEICQENNPQ